RGATVLRWGAELPDAVLSGRPEIPAAMAVAAGLVAGLTYERRRYLELAAHARAEHPERWTPYHEALYAVATLSPVQDDLDAAIPPARTTAERGRRGVDEAAVPAIAGLAHYLFLAGELDEARSLAQEALARPEAKARPHGHVRALAVRALVDAEQNNA